MVESAAAKGEVPPRENWAQGSVLAQPKGLKSQILMKNFRISRI